MFNKNTKKKFISEINIVPLLDILLVLILFFIMLISNAEQNINIDLPKMKNCLPKSNFNSTVIIEIYDIDKYNLIVNNERKEKISFFNINSEIKKQIAINSNASFMIGGSKNIPYIEIIKIIDLLKQYGIKSVGLITRYSS